MSDEPKQLPPSMTTNAWNQFGPAVAEVADRWDSWGSSASSIIPSAARISSGIDSIIPVDPLGVVEDIIDQMAERRDRWAQRAAALPATVDKMSTTTRVLAMGGMAAGAALAVMGVLLPGGKR